MDDRRLVKVSKYLSKHLRHQPERIGLTLRPGGWVPVDELLAACAAHGFVLDRAELDEVVARNDKQRFSFDSDGRSSARTRATASRWTSAWLPWRRRQSCSTARWQALSRR